MLKHLLAYTLLAVALAAPARVRAADDPLRNAPPEYRAALREAIHAFHARDFDAVIKAVDAAEAMRPPTALTLNTRAAVLIEQKKYDEGVAWCRKALALDPKFHPARFNLCEVPFAQGRYAEARALFLKLLEENGHDDLTLYRIYLTWLLEKNDLKAQQVLETIPFPGDTPAHYYAHAAWEFAHGNEEEAKKWIARGNWAFKPEATANFSQPLIALGWLTETPSATRRLPGAPGAPLVPLPKPPLSPARD